MIVVTANHYWFDAAAGAAVACLRGGLGAPARAPAPGGLVLAGEAADEAPA